MPMTRGEIETKVFTNYSEDDHARLPSAKQVIQAQWDDPGGVTPTVFVQAAGTEHKNLNGRLYELYHLIALHVLVLDSKEADGYVAADANETVNSLNNEIVQAFDELMPYLGWQRIEWATPSMVDQKVNFGGWIYRHESYLFRVAP